MRAPISAFRVAALVETLSWAALLVAMFLKHVLGHGDGGVGVLGGLHGVIVLGYVAVALWASSRLRWSNRTVLLALFASVPPGGTLAFERWATNAGQLSPRPAAAD